jgi:hypothetical protein
MFAILTLLFAALADNAEQQALPMTLPKPTQRLGVHLENLLGHARVQTRSEGLFDQVRNAPVPRGAQIQLLHWLNDCATAWQSLSSFDDEPRSMTYALTGGRVRLVLDWLTETGERVVGLSWEEGLRQGMRHRQRSLPKHDAKLLLGPLGAGPIRFRFFWLKDRPNAGTRNISVRDYSTQEWHDYSFDLNQRRFHVQHLVTKDLIRRELAYMQLDHEYSPRDAKFWLSLRDGRGRPFATFRYTPSDAPGVETLDAHLWMDQNVEQFRDDEIEQFFDLVAIFGLYLEPDIDKWSRDARTFLFFHRDSIRPWETAVLLQSDNLFSSNPVGVLGRQLYEIYNEHEMSDELLEKWYEHTVTSSEARRSMAVGPDGDFDIQDVKAIEPGKRYSSWVDDTVALPQPVARMQYRRLQERKIPLGTHLGPPAKYPLLRDHLHEVDFDLYEVENPPYPLLEARYVSHPVTRNIDHCIGESVIQVIIWWNGRDPDGAWWGVLLYGEPTELVDAEGYLNEGKLFDLAGGRSRVSTVMGAERVFMGKSSDLAALLHRLEYAMSTLMHLNNVPDACIWPQEPWGPPGSIDAWRLSST